MNLPFFLRARAAVNRAGARLILRSPSLCARIGAKRARPVDGFVVDPQIAALLALDDLQGMSDLTACTPPKARARLIESVLTCGASPLPGVATRAISLAGPAGPMQARLYVPEGLEAPSPGLVYIHGGGWVTCDLDTHDAYCRRIALEGRLRVVSIEYRLAPEHPFPAAADDATEAFRQVAACAASLDIDPTKIAVSGDSAGGNLTVVVSRRTRGEAHRPALQVPVYPALDATCSFPSHKTLAEGWFLSAPMIEWYYAHYLGKDPARRREPDASPLLTGDFAGMPPALVYTAGFDPLRDEGNAYADRLREAGVPVRYHCFESLVHGFALMTGVCDAAHAAVGQIAREAGEALREGVR